VNETRLLSETIDGGNRYLAAEKPLLSYIRNMELLTCKRGRHC
jgi:hypothetical protein